MNHRERVNAILHYQDYDRIPVVSFGYWNETLFKWAQEGYVTKEEAEGYARQGDSSPADRQVMDRLGFDFNWSASAGGNSHLFPRFAPQVLETRAGGAQVVRNEEGLIVLTHEGLVSIPSEIGTSLTGREAWEELYLPRLRYSKDRVDQALFSRIKAESENREMPLALNAGSLYGNIRNMLGVEGISYLAADDEELYREIIDTVGELTWRVARDVLMTGAKFDSAHFWEDICFKSGPLVNPKVFSSLVGPHYKRLTALFLEHGIDIVSLDCDGKIDLLLPIWLENGVNTMFPIEVGTWNASIAPWRKLYGRQLRGVGGMDKRVFARDEQAVRDEVERLKPLVDLGGYIPCPDHRIAPDAKFPLVAYYCELARKAF